MIIPFKAEHLTMIPLHDSQKGNSIAESDVENNRWVERTDSYTLADGEKILACWGFIPYWPGRSMLWAVISKDTGPKMKALYKIAKDSIDCHKGRIEFDVVSDFEQGIKWANMLGFKCETPEPMKNYYPNGKDAYLFARVS